MMEGMEQATDNDMMIGHRRRELSPRERSRRGLRESIAIPPHL
jgi:hypothetical protein